MARARYRTGSVDLDRRIGELLDAIGVDRDRELLFEVFVTATRLAGDHADTLDLKIVNAALREMREAFKTFTPYHDVPKVTMFGSARTRPDDPLYVQARELAAALAAQGWTVVTGAGPGIMAAGAEGAGPEHSLGVRIRLPFEDGPTPLTAHEEKLVSMKYFFTRKLMLVKESRAFVCLPGGFGTLDETFELLTLTQTGKGVPVPIVFLDIPGGTYWDGASRFIEDELVSRHLVDRSDLNLYLVTDDVERAAKEIVSFYKNFDSMRFVGRDLVIRLHQAPTPAELEDLNERFAHLCADGRIEATTALPEEVADGDRAELPRLKLHFASRYYGQLRSLIDALNTLVA
jgi:uncharacterized protein (TIGR00730 family)